jgi:hypothetical protein
VAIAHTKPDTRPAADCSLSKTDHCEIQIRPLRVEAGQRRALKRRPQLRGQSWGRYSSGAKRRKGVRHTQHAITRIEYRLHGPRPGNAKLREMHNAARRNMIAGRRWFRYRAPQIPRQDTFSTCVAEPQFRENTGAARAALGPLLFGRGKKLEPAVKNEQRQQAGCGRLATDAAADLRLPGEERDKQGGLSVQPALGPFLLTGLMIYARNCGRLLLLLIRRERKTLCHRMMPRAGR